MSLDALLHQEFLNNDIEDWTVALVIMLVSYLLLKLVRYLSANRLTKLALRTATDLDDFVADLLGGTNSFILLIFSIFFGTLRLDFGPEANQTIRMITIFALLIQIGLWLTAIADFWVEREQKKREVPGVHSTTLNIVGIMFKIAAWVLVLLASLDNIPGVRITTLIASLGIGGLAVGLAVQSILSDIFASVSIALDKPFVIGDTISVDDLTGQVEHIGLKSVRMRSLGGQQIVFSTSDLLSSRIHNFRKMERRMVILRMGVSYKTPGRKVVMIPGIMEEIISQFEQVTFSRSHFTGFGNFSLDFETAYHIEVPDFTVYMDTRQAVGFAVLARFEEEGIEIPFPTQTILLSQLPQTDPAES